MGTPIDRQGGSARKGNETTRRIQTSFCEGAVSGGNRSVFKVNMCSLSLFPTHFHLEEKSQPHATRRVGCIHFKCNIHHRIFIITAIVGTANNNTRHDIQSYSELDRTDTLPECGQRCYIR